jgi:hypothetical protein
MRHAGRAVLCALLLAALGRAASAQSATPSPAPPPAGFTAHAHANVNVVLSGTTYNAVGRFGLAQRTNLLRVDILSLTSDTMPIPPITATALIDHGTNTVTLWNDTTRRYYTHSLVPSFGRGASPAPSPSPRPSASPRSSPRPSPRPSRVPAQRGSPFRNLQVLSVTLRLTGHTTTAGLPTTGLAFDFQIQGRNDRAPTHVTASTQLADDYVAFPMTIDASIEPGSGSFNGKLSYAVDDLTRGLPAASLFAVPAGYTKVDSPFQVLFAGGGGPRPGPAMSSPAPAMSSPAPASTPH